MRVKWLVLFFIFCSLAVLSGCDINVNPYKLTSDEITGIWVETLPALSDSPKYTNDPETISGMIEYINGLKLRLRTARDEDIAGMASRIEISYADGTVREFWHSGNVYFRETDGDTQYVMEYEQAALFEDEIYNKMQTVPLIKGVVKQVFDNDSERNSFLVSVDPSAQNLVGDKTSVSVIIMPPENKTKKSKKLS